MATGMAKGAKESGQRVAFGDGRRILWDGNSETIFRGNPNIARPGSERDRDVVWIRYHKGHRIYNTQDRKRNRWVWNTNFRAQAGELYFDPGEKRNGRRFGEGFIIIEPNIEAWKGCAPNKDWGREKYQALADKLVEAGHEVRQFGYDKGRPLPGIPTFRTLGFRDALAIMSHAALYIGPEGGLHHGAAAVGTPAVVLFGGFIPPIVTGYEQHTNLTGGATACGSLSLCQHCIEAMAKISVEEVFDAAARLL
jgi:hypothetical protein